MNFKSALLIAGFIGLGASPALAWGDMYMGDGTTRAGQNLVYPYPGVANYCPAGLQPVLANGEICCGKPNTNASYYNAPSHKKKRHIKKTYTPRAYAPVGEKGVYYK